MLATLLPALRELSLPLRLQLWDGKAIDLGPAPSVTLAINDPEIVADLAHPSLDLLGAAYVEGRLDLDGPLDEVIRIGDELSRALGKDETAAPLPEYPDKGSETRPVAERGTIPC